jgi:hypothetical protein
MSGETVPVSFDAVDNLTGAVKKMTDALDKLTAGHEEAGKAGEEQGAKSESLGDTLAELADTTAIMERATQLAGAAWAAAGAVYEKLSEGISASLTAWDEQSKKSGKSASALGSVAESSAKLDRSVTKLLAQLGKMIERSGSIQVTYAITVGVLDEVRKILKEVDDQAGATAGTLGGDLADGASSFFKTLDENSEVLAKFIVGIGLLDDGARYNYLTFKALINLIKIEFYQTLEEGARALSKLLLGLEQMAQATGVDLPAGLKDARVALDGMTFGARYLANSGIADLITNVDELGDVTQNVIKEVGGLGGIEENIKRIAGAGERAVKKVKEQLDKGGERRRGDLVSPEDAAAEARAAALLDLDRQILLARKDKNEQLAIELERERELVALGQSLREIKTSTLRDATQSAESLRIQIDYEQKLKDLEQTRRDDRRAGYEIEDQAWREQMARDEEADAAAKERYDTAIARIQSRYDFETEQLSLMGDTISEAMGHIPDLLDEISDSTARMLGGFGKAAAGITPLISAMRAYNAAGATTQQQQDALNAGLLAGVGILSGVTESFVEDKRTQAAIEALINAAAATAAYATGNVPMGIGLTAAAAGYAAAAAFGGGGSSTPSVGGSAGGGASSAGFSSPDLERERVLNAEALAEAIAQEGRGGGTVINVDFGNSLIASDSPQAARIITNLITPELEQIMGRSR